MKKIPKIGRIRGFFLALLDENNDRSTKRFVTLIATLFYIIGSTIAIGLFLFVSIHPTQGNLEFLKIITISFNEILEKTFLIILGGLGFMTAKDFATAIVERAKARASGSGDILIQNADNVDNTTGNRFNSRNIDTPENP